jgi:hypothetical protein
MDCPRFQICAIFRSTEWVRRQPAHGNGSPDNPNYIERSGVGIMNFPILGTRKGGNSNQ